MSNEHRFQCSCVRESTSPHELSQCRRPFQEHFIKAWEASKGQDYESFKQSISKLKAVARDPSTQKILTPLDVFRVLEGSGMVYAMTLMAFCGVHGQKEMVQLLLNEGAKIDAGCNECGAPLFQMIYHCIVQNVELDPTMVQYFIAKNSPLDREIWNHEFDGQSVGGGYAWSVLDLPLTMTTGNGFEIAKVLVEVGKVDPITGGTPRGEKHNVVPMFEEYHFKGTNNYIRWLCKEYIPKHTREEFVNRVLKCITSMKKDEDFTTWEYEQRTPSHAILTSGHEETITLLVQKGKEQGENFLTETNSIGKTALHIAAENGDLESVQILLKLKADVTACDSSNLNPFMLALAKGHELVAKAILVKNSDCLGSGTIEWALEKNLTLFFQMLGQVAPDTLVAKISDGDNTIVHLVAAAGNAEIFKIILEMSWSKTLIEEVVNSCNGEKKTALQLAVERECIDILKVLEKRLERPGPPSVWQSEWRNKWRSEVIPPLFLHGSSCGSLSAVKYFINNGYQPNMSYQDSTPLLCASDAGHDETVAYLLQHRVVSSNPKNMTLPLLHAAANGHTKCVTLLLEKKASVLQTDTTGKNCLMLAITNLHKETALAILSDEEQGLDALKCVEKGKEKESTPLRLLIKEMPDLAEYALNRNIAIMCKDEPPLIGEGSDVPDSGEPGQKHRVDYQRETSITYDFQLFDDLVLEGASEDNKTPPTENIPLVECDGGREEEGTATHQYKLQYKSDNHILKWMIDYKRLKLLQHPLVKEYLFHKFWLVTFPLFFGYLLLYCVFLILLTSFTLVSPRPGPDSETCPEGNPNITANGTDCTGQSEVERGFLAGTAGLILFLCLFLLFMESIQLYQRHWKYFKEFDNYFQVTVFFTTIIFVAPGFTNDCWCAHNWQWQIGALSLCLSWFNLIIVLKDIPWTAIPINMFINICITFLKVLFLPFLLLMAFALPFYMVFVRTVSASEGTGVPALVSFTSPAHAIAKTMVQIVGEIDFEVIFNEGDLLYNPMAYIIFVIFLVIVPVLFINLLIGLAVGDTKEQKKKAEFTKIEVQVGFILERERNSKFLREICVGRRAEFDKSDEIFDPEGFCGKHRLTRFLARLLGLEYKRHFKVVNQIEGRNKAIFSEVMGISEIDAVKTTLQQESEKILQLKEEIKALTGKVETLSKNSNTFTTSF